MELTHEEQETVLQSKLFYGVTPQHLGALLTCLTAERRHYPAGAIVIEEGEQVHQVGLVLSGHARSLKKVENSEPLIISLQEKGSFLGVLLAASRTRKSPLTVQAQEDLSVLFFPAERLIFPCEQSCADHAMLLRNFLDSVAEMSLTLNDRIECLIRPSVREKITAYLQRVSQERGTTSFTVPLDRSAMARYLNVERSALSRELSRMKAEGLIDYWKNHFEMKG